MKNNKKGFTLIELLAVIAILAILVVLAVPAILDIFNTSKKNAFVTQAQTIYKAAEEEYLTKQLGTTPVYTFCKSGNSSSNPLSLQGTKDVDYIVTFGNSGANLGKVISIKVKQGTNGISLPESGTNPVNIAEITAEKISSDVTITCN